MEHLLNGRRLLALLACSAGVALPLAPAEAGATAVHVAAGDEHTCAVLVGGRVQCWGSNAFGQLGDGTLTRRTAPVDVVGLPFAAVAVTGGYWHSCALSASGSVACWGANGRGQLGDGTDTDRLVATPVPGLAGVRAIVAGNRHTCALTTDGTVLCWGDNRSRQLGVDEIASRSTPAPVGGLPADIAAIAAGSANSAAVTRDGSVRFWGQNGTVQRCDPPGAWGPPLSYCRWEGVHEERPVNGPEIAGGFAAVSMSLTPSSRYNVCGLGTTGRVLCWAGAYDAPNEPAVERSEVPPGVTALALGAYHRCVLVGAGDVQCWGGNASGQLGDGTSVNRSTPAGVGGLPAPATVIVAGWSHSCALTQGGDVWCWGGNGSGQLGDGTATNRLVPVKPLLRETSPPGSAPPFAAVEYRHAGFDHYFVTAQASEIAALDAGQVQGWARTGGSFAVRPPGTPGFVDVCRFWSGASFAPKSSHFYTSSGTECAALMDDAVWRFEGRVFAIATADASGQCGTGAMPLYRLYNDGAGGAPNHRYTTSQATRFAMLALGWRAEGIGLGVIGCVPTQ